MVGRGRERGREFKNGMTDGLIAKADLNHRRYKKRTIILTLSSQELLSDYFWSCRIAHSVRKLWKKNKVVAGNNHRFYPDEGKI